MARAAVACKVQARLGNGTAVLTAHARPVDPVNGATIATTQAAVAAALAVLVADGASPTEGHVTTLDAAYTALVADIAPLPANADVVISYNATTVVDLNALRQAVDELLRTLPFTL